MVYRELSAQPQTQADFEEFLADLYRDLRQGVRDPNEVVRDTLCQMYLGTSTTSADVERLLPGARALMHSFDPRNVTTEPE